MEKSLTYWLSLILDTIKSKMSYMNNKCDLYDPLNNRSELALNCAILMIFDIFEFIVIVIMSTHVVEGLPLWWLTHLAS